MLATTGEALPPMVTGGVSEIKTGFGISFLNYT
jgi:hypothetical protein